MDKRNFVIVIGSKEYGLYISSKPSSAAKKVVSKLCASNKSKKVEFSLREITQGSKKKTYGPYLGEMKKLKKPIKLKGRIIRYDIKVHLKKRKSSIINTSKKMKGGGEHNGEQQNEPIILLNGSISPFMEFIRSLRINTSNSSNNLRDSRENMKRDLLQRLQSMSRRPPESRKTIQYFFYVYRTDPKPAQIISVGAISGLGIYTNTQLHDENSTQIHYNKKFLNITNLFSIKKENLGIESAIYHILLKLPQKIEEYEISGICLDMEIFALEYYDRFGFRQLSRSKIMMLYKNNDVIDSLKRYIDEKDPITTEFYSNYPYFIKSTED